MPTLMSLSVFNTNRCWLILVTCYAVAVVMTLSADGANFCTTKQTTINDPATVEWVNKLVSAIGEDTACHIDRADDDQGSFVLNTPCNIFAGRVLERVYRPTVSLDVT